MKWIIASVLSLVTLAGSIYANDLLNQTFSPSVNGGYIINIGNDSTSVGNSIFRPGVDAGLNSDGFLAWERDPLMVRIAKLLLRITIALSVTFIIYQAIKYAIAMNNESDQSAAQQKLINIIINLELLLPLLLIPLDFPFSLRLNSQHLSLTILIQHL